MWAQVAYVPEESRNGELDAGAAPDDLALDTVFEALSHRRRRYVLACLAEDEAPTPLTALAEEVASRENEAPVSEISHEEILERRISLEHRHLPKLADVGLISYDREQNLVREKGAADRVQRVRALAEASAGDQ